LAPRYRPSTLAQVAGASSPLSIGATAAKTFFIAGLVQVSIGNATMRPFILVGTENTQRRRDLMPGETHTTIHHPAAIAPFRRLVTAAPSTK
jgi:hypothetical protein